MSGKPGRSGRRKAITTEIKEALDKNDSFLPTYLGTLRDIALGSEGTIRERMECLFYLINRSQGAPKAQTDLRVKGEVRFTADELALMVRPALEEKALLAEYSQIEEIDSPNNSQSSP